MARRSSRTGACCAGQDIYDARDRRRPARHRPLCASITKAASATGVIERFADEYAPGRTPVPCMPLQPGREVHRPVRLRPRPRRRLPRHRPLCPPRRNGAAGAELHRAADPARDQSYFLLRHHPRAARLPALPARRPAQERGARARGGARAGRSPTSPTARTSASSPTATMPALVKQAPARSGARRARSSTSTARVLGDASRRRPLHRRPAPRASRSAASPSRSTSSGIEPEQRRRGGRPAARAGGRGGAGRADSTGSARTRRDGSASRSARWRRPVAGARSTASRRALRRARIWRRAGPGGGVL